MPIIEKNPPKGECVMIIEGKSFQELKEQSQEEFLKIPLSRAYEPLLWTGSGIF